MTHRLITIDALRAELAAEKEARQRAEADAASWKRLTEMRDEWLDTIAAALGFVGDTDELIARVKEAAAEEKLADLCRRYVRACDTADGTMAMIGAEMIREARK